MVNVAYDAPVDMPPREQIEEAERRLYELAESGRYDGGFQSFSHGADAPPSTWPATPTSATATCPASATGLTRSRPARWAACSVRPDHPRRPPVAWARPRSPPTSPSTSPRPSAAKRSPTARSRPSNGGIVGFFSLEMSAEQLATRILAEQIGHPLLQDPPRRDHTRTSSASSPRPRARCSAIPLYIDQTGGISIAQLAARARRLKRQQRPRPAGRRLPAAAHRLVQDAATTACRRSPRSPPASRRWPRN